MDVRRIVYDPVSWIHTQRFSAPAQVESVRVRSIINDILLCHYNLACGEIDLSRPKAKYLVDNWYYLARGAFMAACHRYRASLAYVGKLTKLDKTALAFTLTGVSSSQDNFRGNISIDDIWQYGYSELNFFAKSESALLTGRLPLLFPMSVNPERSENIGENNELLIRVAIQYARKSQQF